MEHQGNSLTARVAEFVENSACKELNSHEFAYGRLVKQAILTSQFHYKVAEKSGHVKPRNND
jgi:hypothetical protein